MGNEETKMQDNQGEKKKLKPCCACPETKKARDTWYVNYNSSYIYINT